MMSWGMFLAIPCPCRIWDEKARPHMVACLPLTGGVVGLVWAAMAWLLQRLGCAAPLRAVLLAAAPWLVTGFLHLDGFMDVCDALLSRRDLATRQKILKDSHCGAFAVICMVLLAAGQCALFAGAPWLRLLPLGALPVASRACASVAVQRLRPMGTSQYAAMQRGTAQNAVRKALGRAVIPAGDAEQAGTDENGHRAPRFPRLHVKPKIMPSTPPAMCVSWARPAVPVTA